MRVITAPSLPSFASCLTGALYHASRIGVCFGTRAQLATSATAFGGLMGGLLLSCFCQKNETVRLTGRMVMIAQRAIAAAKAQIAFASNIIALKESCQIDVKTPPRTNVSLQSWSFLSISQQKRMAYTLNRVIEIVKKVLYYLISMIVSLFATSSYLRDLARAIQGEEEAIDQGVRELCINCSACVDDSVEILRDLRHYEVHIHRIMRFLGATYECELVTEKAIAGCRVMAAVCSPFLSIAKGIQKVTGFAEDPPKRAPSSPLRASEELIIYAKLSQINTSKR